MVMRGHAHEGVAIRDAVTLGSSVIDCYAWLWWVIVSYRWLYGVIAGYTAL